MNSPSGAPSAMLMTISPVSPGAANVPSVFMILTSYIGLALPIDPGLGVVFSRFPMVRVVSV